MGGASIAILLLPFVVQASSTGFFSLSALVGGSAGTGNTSSLVLNSQTVPVLTAATNIDPNPAVGGGDITVADGGALVSDEGPSGTAADILSQPSNAQISVYTVRPGDTLSQIAQMFGVSVGTILGANDIQNGIIQPGETLIILPITGIEHTVIAGDTLSNLATKYNSNAHDIAVYNGLADDAALTVGNTILIPGGETVPAAAAPAPAPRARTMQKIARSSSREPYLGGSGPAIDGYFGWPLPADAGVITQGLHGWNAVDIGAPRGTDIYAAAAGTVIVANADGAWNGGYGNYVVISHQNGTETLYAHMSKVLSQPGEQVSQGQTIGLVGMTGMATGPHVHFEVRGAVNPFASLDLGSGDPF